MRNKSNHAPRSWTTEFINVSIQASLDGSYKFECIEYDTINPKGLRHRLLLVPSAGRSEAAHLPLLNQEEGISHRWTSLYEISYITWTLQEREGARW